MLVSIADLLPIDLINEAYSLTDTVTIRTRKLNLESMAWLLVGVAIYNDKSMADIINLLDIVDREDKPFVRLLELVKQELGGILLTYNMICYQMVKMCHTLKEDYLPYQLSFNGALAHMMQLLVGFPTQHLVRYQDN